MTADNLDHFVKQYKSRDLLRVLLHFVYPYRVGFVLASLSRLIGDVINLYPAYAMATIVTFFSQYEVGDSLKTFWVILSLFGLAVLTRTILVGVAKYLTFNIAEKVSLDAQLAGTHHMAKLDIAWHERENVGNRVKRIQRGGESMNRILRIWIGNVIEICVNFVGMIVIISQTSIHLSISLLVFIIIFLVISQRLIKHAANAAHVVNNHEEDFHGILFQAAQNIRTVKAIGAVKSIMKYLRHMVYDLAIAIRRRVMFFQGRSHGLTLYSHIVKILAFAFIGYGISQGRFELGFLVLFHGYFNALWVSADELSNVSQEYVIARQSIARLANMLEEKHVIESSGRKLAFPTNWKTIRFDNVSFNYGQQLVLNNISFELNRGERLGLIGLSGAGKSTLMKLLLKEYDPSSGKILIDGIDSAAINRDSYLKKVAVVLQETDVFNFSLRDNITISDAGKIDKRRLEKAMEVAHINDFLNKLPELERTLIGEKGIKLSGGEKQRLGLARAIYKNPQLLLLDEATSHLDLESEQKIQDSLHQFFQEVTAVVIAHRLTTVKEMDRILVIENGVLVENGSFDELLKKKGRFAELWKKQTIV